MAEPSNPHNVEGENHEQRSPAAAEEDEDDGGAPGGGLPVLKWSKGQFEILMTSIQMAKEFGATYPQEGDTGADAPAGFITLWAEFFNDGNLRLPVTVYFAEMLEYYHLHISQLSPFGMFQIRNFEYTFRALGLDVTVENFRRFYQLTIWEHEVDDTSQGSDQVEEEELINVKVANAALGKEKVAAEADACKAREAKARATKALEEAKEVGARAAKALKEAKEREGRVSKALEEANADRTRLNQTVGSLQVTARATEATARATEAETRASEAVEARDSLTSSFNQLETDREWMRCHGIAHIVRAILDAPETATGIDVIKQRARDAGFKAGYNRCIGHLNILAQGEYTDERSGFHGVNTEALLEAATTSFYDMSISALEKLDECLDAEDYVDRLRMLYAGAEESEEEKAAGDGKDGAGTSGTK
ncbi:hypothetical protein HanPSC8_Chr05g0193721 [Helianthus annuus]|nr:hypothetical protein HanPSC8_Chr05g0193721 [Helianthus annuus]